MERVHGTLRAVASSALMTAWSVVRWARIVSGNVTGGVRNRGPSPDPFRLCIAGRPVCLLNDPA